MRQTMSGFLAALAMMAVGAVPASACGGLFGGGCSPCGYVSPCAQTYVRTYSGCGAAYERLPNPDVQYHAAPAALPQYYYVNQGPTFTGPGDFAPYPRYQEGGLSGWRAYHHRRHYEGRWHTHRHFRPWHHAMAPHRYGYRPVLRSYY
ncbi:MAG TPA: hypothetical protein VKT76_18815 [Bradyrhizobium sp.]|nr:hypothetical protein [Bradyrhizobium sp.]